MKPGITILWVVLSPAAFCLQLFNETWAGYARDPQHTARAAVAAQPLYSIHWSAPVDFNPPDSEELSVHYGSISITANNTVLVPLKTGAAGGFEIRAYRGATGALLYVLTSPYSLPASTWIPSYGPTLSAGERLYYAGAGGTVYYRDFVDSMRGPNGRPGATGNLVFYGRGAYEANHNLLDAAIQISTPITADRNGNIFFGFVAAAGNPAGLVSGLARIGRNGIGRWVSAAALAGGDPNVTQVALNCAPALSNDQRTVYVAVSGGDEFTTGYLVSLNAATLKPAAHAPLLDPRGGPATISSDSSASPMVAPDGDVFYGVLEGDCCTSHNGRGWMLHFDATLAVSKIPGSFGWDNTASVVPANIVGNYQGTSRYLILTKYNNYATLGTGDGVNKMAVLDPEAAQVDEYSPLPVQVMQEVVTIAGVTSDAVDGFPDAVSEWCVNTAAVDPLTRSALINSEDGVLYRWDLATNTFLQRITLSGGRSQAYTPTAVGPDGTVYAINDAVLYAVGK